MTADPVSPADLLARRLGADPAAPLLTFYDDASGERTEVSVTTVANWVAKTANLLSDEIGLGEHAVVAICLPLHWQSAVLLLAAWAYGAEVSLAEPADVPAAELLVCDESSLPSLAGADTGLVLALSLRPMNQPMTAPRPGVVDFAAEVLAQGDRFTPWSPVDPDAVALRIGSSAWTGRELVAAANDVQLSAADRVLSVLPTTTLDGLLAGLLGPLAAGASAVLCAHADPTALAHRADAERVTVTAGIELPALRTLVG